MSGETFQELGSWSDVCSSTREPISSSVAGIRSYITSQYGSVTSQFYVELETPFDIKVFLSNLIDEIRQLEQRKEELLNQALEFNLDATTYAVAHHCLKKKIQISNHIVELENILADNYEMDEENDEVNRRNNINNDYESDVESSVGFSSTPLINNSDISHPKPRGLFQLPCPAKAIKSHVTELMRPESPYSFLFRPISGFISKNTMETQLDGIDYSKYLPQFNQWINDFKNNVYDYAPVERHRRLKVFVANFQEIDRLNQKYGPSTKFGLNEYADLTWDEFKIRLHSFAPNRFPEDWEGNPDERDIEKLTAAPGLGRFSLINGEQQIVTPVKNQGSCSAGWAFAAVAVAEARARIIRQGNLFFSEQQILDIVDDGCERGDLRNAFRHFQDFGVPSEKLYPYTGVHGNQKYGYPLMKLSKIKDLPRDEIRMAYSLKDGGPFAVTFKVGRSFQFYKSGVLSSDDCETNENLWHSVAVIGFGIGYWEIKNSFGTSWGKGGFGQLKRGSNWNNIEDGPITGWF